MYILAVISGSGCELGYYRSNTLVLKKNVNMHHDAVPGRYGNMESSIIMRNLFLYSLIAIVLAACSFSGKSPPQPQKVLGVMLGGSVQELKTAYGDRKLPLTQTDDDRYESSDAVQPLEGFRINRVEYYISSGVLGRVEAILESPTVSDIEAFIDKEYSYDPGNRREFEDRLRWTGNIGDEDHIWFFSDMGIVLIVDKNATRLIYSLK